MIVGGTLATNATKNATEGADIAVSTSDIRPAYSGTRSGVTVESGDPAARFTVDVYADFLCPSCEAFHEANGEALTRHVNEGDVRVRYHMVPLLADASDPPGYSLDAANASLCAADAGHFTAFHDSLFDSQPEEGTRGYDRNQLTALGMALGAPPSFADCVADNRYATPLRAELDRVRHEPALLQDTRDGQAFATPTVTVNGRKVDFRDTEWLDAVLAKGS